MSASIDNDRIEKLWANSTEPIELVDLVSGYPSERRPPLEGITASMWSPRLNRLFPVALLRSTTDSFQLKTSEFSISQLIELLDAAERVADNPAESDSLLHSGRVTVSVSKWGWVDILDMALGFAAAEWGDYLDRWGGETSRLTARLLYVSSIQYVFYVLNAYHHRPPIEPVWTEETLCHLLRDFLYGPERPQVEPQWLTRDVTTMADACYNSCVVEDPSKTQGRYMDPVMISALADALEEVSCPTNRIVTQLRTGKHFKGCWCVDLLRSQRAF